jgi:hypothetical protein
LFFTEVVIPFPFPNVQVYVEAALVPVEVFVKVTARGEHPEFTLGVKSATSCACAVDTDANNKIIASRQHDLFPRIIGRGI